ncbi:MAG: hypothetical protein MJ252_08400 [archaeon]|nr:hypothetical protein [archaeon]
MSSFYNKKEISEWSCSELCNYLNSKNHRTAAEICQSNSITGYDIFFLNENVVKEEFGIKKFHDRQSFLKHIQPLIYEYCKNISLIYF